MAQSRIIRRWISAGSALSFLAVGLASLPAAQAATTYTVYNSPQGRIDGSEIVDITPDGSRAFIAGVEAGDRRLYAITVNPLNGLQETRTDLTAVTSGKGLTVPVPSSVSIHPSGKFAFVTIREDDPTTRGTAGEPAGIGVFVPIGPDGTPGVPTETVQLGIRPEHVDIAPNGEYAVVANEGADAGAQTGSIQIVDLDPTGTISGTVVKTFPASTLGPGTRPDPEAVAISPDSTRAYVTIQSAGDFAIINVDLANLAASTITLDDEQSATGNRPDGLAVTPDGGFVIVANEGANTVTLYQVGGNASTPNLVAVDNKSPGPDTVPEMVAIGNIGGVLKAAVSLERTDSVAIYNLSLGTTPSLQLDTVVSLNPGTQVPGQPAGVGTAPAYGPEGIAIATTSANVSYIVTANAGRNELVTKSQNVSVIVANSTEPQPSPGTKRIYLPLITK